MKVKKRIGSLIIVILLLASGLIYWGVNSRKAVSGNSKEIKVFTSIYPLYFAAQQVAGDNLNIKLVVPNGAEIHSYDLSPRKIAQLERADMLFYIGLGLEPWAEKVEKNLKEKKLKMVKVSKVEGIKLLGEEGHKEHSHQGQYDPHLWLDPVNMQQIAKCMRDNFMRLDSENSGEYQKNYAKFADKIKDLDEDYRESLMEVEQDYILVSHAAFGYLGHRYGFKQLAVTGIAPHEEPSPRTLAELTKKAKKHNLKYIFMETLANPKTVNVLAQETGLEILPLNPIAGLTPDHKQAGEDYFSLMEENLHNLKKALGDENEFNSGNK